LFVDYEPSSACVKHENKKDTAQNIAQVRVSSISMRTITKESLNMNVTRNRAIIKTTEIRVNFKASFLAES